MGAVACTMPTRQTVLVIFSSSEEWWCWTVSIDGQALKTQAYLESRRHWFQTFVQTASSSKTCLAGVFPCGIEYSGAHAGNALSSNRASQAAWAGWRSCFSEYRILRPESSAFTSAFLFNTALHLQPFSLSPASSSHSHEGFSSLTCPEQQRRDEGGWRHHSGESEGCQDTLQRSAAWCGAGSGSCSFAYAQSICLYTRVSELSRLTEIS